MRAKEERRIEKGKGKGRERGERGERGKRRRKSHVMTSRQGGELDVGKEVCLNFYVLDGPA